MKRAKRLYWVRIAHLPLSNIVARTFRKHLPEIIANITANNALLRQLMEKQ